MEVVMTSKKLPKIELHQITEIPRADLVERWKEAHGASPPRGISRRLLEYAAAYDVQAKVFGGLKPTTKKKLQRLASNSQTDDRPPNGRVKEAPAKKRIKLALGSQLVREWQGRTHRVAVTKEGFQYNNEHYASLSHVARNQDKKLIVNKIEAETVRALFQLYLKLKNVTASKAEANRMGLITKVRTYPGRLNGGIAFSRGHLYQLLHNPIYAGDIAHKGKTYPGQHDAIIPRDIWDQVQVLLNGNAARRSSYTNNKQMNLLTGVIFDEDGETISPSYATKNGRRYRYYISKKLVHETKGQADGWRLPAKQLEDRIISVLHEFLNDQSRLMDKLDLHECTMDQISAVLGFAKQFAEQFQGNNPAQRHEAIRSLVSRVTLRTSGISIVIDASQLGCEPGQIALEMPLQMRRRGVERKIILLPLDATEPDPKLIKLIADTRYWFGQLTSGKATSVREIAQLNEIDENDVSRFLPIAFLAPDIVETILSGKHPPELTPEKLKRLKSIPPSWGKQHQLLGIDT